MNIRKLILVSLAIGFLSTASLGQERKALTNKDVIDLVKQGLNESLILKAIQANDCDFDVSAQGLAQLQAGGVNQTIMEAMATAQTNKKSGSNGQPPAHSAATSESSSPVSNSTAATMPESNA